MKIFIDQEDKEILLLLIRKAIDSKPDYMRTHEHKLNHIIDQVEGAEGVLDE